MKKVLAILAVVTLLMSSAAFATMSRVGGTGLPLWMIADDAQIVLEPSVLAKNTNLAVIETDGTGIWGMVTADLGEGSSLGIYASWPEMAISSVPSSLLMMLGPLDIPTGTGVLYGMDLDGMGLTVGLAYGSAGEKYEEGETEGFENGDYETANGWGLAVPVGLSLSGDMPMDINLIVELASIAMYEAKDYDDTTGDLVSEMYQGASTALIVGLAAKAQTGDLIGNISGGIATAPGAGMWAKSYDTDGSLLTHTEMAVDIFGWNANLGLANVFKGNRYNNSNNRRRHKDAGRKCCNDIKGR